MMVYFQKKKKEKDGHVADLVLHLLIHDAGKRLGDDGHAFTVVESLSQNQDRQERDIHFT